MKKTLSMIVLAAVTLVACGPSAEEKAAAEKMRQDSINAAMAKITEDSIAAVQAAAEKMRQDSIAAAEAEAAAAVQAKQGAKKTVKQAPKKEEVPQAAPNEPKVGMKKPGAK